MTASVFPYPSSLELPVVILPIYFGKLAFELWPHDRLAWVPNSYRQCTVMADKNPHGPSSVIDHPLCQQRKRVSPNITLALTV